MGLRVFRVFAEGGRPVPRWTGIAVIVCGAFAIGLGVAWVTTVVPQFFVSSEPSVSPSGVPTAVVSIPAGPDVPVDLYTPITRPLDSDDTQAGLTSLGIGAGGTGMFAVVPGIDTPDTTAPIRWVRIEVEDGLPFDQEALSTYVMGILGDPQGWGANGRFFFARTSGAADIRIVFAAPNTADALCVKPHAASASAVAEETPPDPMEVVDQASPAARVADGVLSPSPSVPPEAQSCADQGILVVNAYRWADGLAGFPEDRVAARAYLLNHPLGHIVGNVDVECHKGIADVMALQDLPVEKCTPNPWPHPAPAVE